MLPVKTINVRLNHEYILHMLQQDRTKTLWLQAPVGCAYIQVKATQILNQSSTQSPITIPPLQPTNSLRLLPTDSVSKITIHQQLGALLTRNNSPSCSTIHPPHCCRGCRKFDEVRSSHCWKASCIDSGKINYTIHNLSYNFYESHKLL